MERSLHGLPPKTKSNGPSSSILKEVNIILTFKMVMLRRSVCFVCVSECVVRGWGHAVMEFLYTLSNTKCTKTILWNHTLEKLSKTTKEEAEKRFWACQQVKIPMSIFGHCMRSIQAPLFIIIIFCLFVHLAHMKNQPLFFGDLVDM